MKMSQLVALGGGLLLPSMSHAASSVALIDVGSGAYSLASFDSASPGTAAYTPVTGLASGDNLMGLDFRPANNSLYAVGTLSNVYTINRFTGSATLVGSYSETVPGTTFGFDFNPALVGPTGPGQYARIISDLNDNRVIDGENGAYLGSTEKTDVFYAVGDANEGADPNIAHIGYTNSIPGATSTQQYGIDADLNVLVTVANNAGTLMTVGSLGIDAGVLGGFDIDGATGEAILGFQQGGGISSIYSVDLTTGAATSLGFLSGDIVGLTAVPEPSVALLGGLGAVAFFRRRRAS